MKTKLITIAIQKKGRLSSASKQFLQTKNIFCETSEEKLISRCNATDVQLLYLRDDDIPEYVKRGVADMGIVGQNVLQNKQIGQ